MPYNFTTIEKKWQQYWLDHKTFRALEPAEAGQHAQVVCAGHVPLSQRSGPACGASGRVHGDRHRLALPANAGTTYCIPMGWDAFGLPAEQYAIKTNTHPAHTTEQNIANFRRQIQMLGLSYDWDREIDTTDPEYYKWTQWIFLQLFNSYFDPIEQKARPIAT